MGAIAIKLPKPRKQNVPSVEEIADSGFTSAQRRSLMTVASSYLRKLSRIRDLIAAMMGGQQFCVLLDCDVVRHFASPPKGYNEETLFVNYIVHASEAEFAIPIGAFEELLEHFDRKKRRAVELSAVVSSSLNREQTIEALAEHFDVLSSGQKSDPPLAESEIEQHLDDELEQLQRLISIFGNTRFKGVVVEHDQRLANAIECVLQNIERSTRWNRQARTKGQSRTKRDRRDAINQAIALDSLKEPCRRILVTETKFLLQLPSIVDESDDSQLQSAMEELNEILGNQNGLISRYYPVASPAELVVLDIIGGLSDPVLARTRARQIQETFSTLSDVLDADDLQSRAHDDNMRRAIAPRLKADRKHAIEKLTMLRTDLLDHESILPKLEAERASRHAANGRFPVEESDTLGLKSRAFVRLLEDLTRTVEEKNSIEYSVDWDETEFSTAYEIKSFVLTRHINRMPLPQNGGVIGQQFLPPTQSAKLVGERILPFVSVQWNIMCPDELLGPLLNEILHMSLPAQPLAGDAAGEPPDVWQEGCIAYTSLGDYGFSLDMAYGDGQWGMLKRDDLQSYLATQLGQSEFVVERIRINTHFMDIIYDYLPNDGSLYRQLGILTHYKISAVLARMIDATSTGLIHLKALERALEIILSPLEPLTSGYKS